MNKITLYPSNWLYNAGVMGLLRILEWARGEYVVNEILSQGLEDSYLKNFETYYFEYATRVYLRDEFRLRETRKVFKDETYRVYEIEKDFRKDMDNLRTRESWEPFSNELESNHGGI